MRMFLGPSHFSSSALASPRAFSGAKSALERNRTASVTPNEALALDASCVWSERIARQLPRCDRGLVVLRTVSRFMRPGAWDMIGRDGHLRHASKRGSELLSLGTSRWPGTRQLGNKGTMEINAKKQKHLQDVENVGCAEERDATRKQTCAANEYLPTVEKDDQARETNRVQWERPQITFQGDKGVCTHR